MNLQGGKKNPREDKSRQFIKELPLANIYVKNTKAQIKITKRRQRHVPVNKDLHIDNTCCQIVLTKIGIPVVSWPECKLIMLHKIVHM